MNIKRGFKSTLAGCMMAMILSVTALAASESLNGGGATWSGGENADGILYSQLVDNEEDGVAYEITVWVQDDKGGKSEKTGTTDAVGTEGRVRVTRASTHSNPLVAEKCGYNGFKAVSAD